ncbi:MAG: ABC-type antimicrobial peptide transport system, permease component [Candidatus Kapaibacterium sp.]|nr:MAG: ABC-type antimicrobial peptide transport system, permease component [Candidatus Kapabacteria bacterium]
MKIFAELFEGVRLSLESIIANKLRAFLATLGVVIGISFVVLMGWAISGLDKALQDSINLIGEDMLYIDKWDWAGGKSWKEVRNRKDITYQQAKELISQLTLAEIAVPGATTWNAQVKANNITYTGLSVYGTTADYGRLPAGDVEIGRFFSYFEERETRPVAVLGHKVAKTFFGNENPIGKYIKIKGRNFEVIGVVKKQGTMLLDFIDDRIYIPIGNFLDIFGGEHRRSISIGIKAGSLERMDDVREEARGLMRVIRNLKPWEEDDFSINETKAFEEIVSTFRLYVWGIGIGMTTLAFIVGMIGIMNIMFVSVAERTKEIGIRKAVGAKNRSILLQFLVESATLCLAGALTSIIVCSILVFAVAKLLPRFVPETAFLQPYLPLDFVFYASIVAILVGAIAGLLPAIRASRVDPIESLRYE